MLTKKPRKMRLPDLIILCRDKEPVLVIGAGPSGLFAALKLIEQSFKPIILERGKKPMIANTTLRSLI